MYEDQLYIQPSVQMMREVESATSDAIKQRSVDMPRVRWNPYIITGLYSVLCDACSCHACQCIYCIIVYAAKF